jgi:DNA-binding transcriptional ArsR family regulator
MVQLPDRLDSAFSALGDPTRRRILERVGRAEASITDLADAFGMTLTGMKKHVQVLEHAGLITTEKLGRVRYCRPGRRRLKEEIDWITRYQTMLEARYDRLGEFLERTRGERS